ncbi:MAG: hypothetical protein PHD87_04810 [Candidatus Cloacimonetes bacterium]|nr:hypothetical protein [Candidatus Cloacimonadota bacterium]
MRRCMALVGLIALLTGCCIAQTGEDGIKATLFSDGEARPCDEADELAAAALRLLQNAGEVAMLAVGPDLIDSIKASDMALEIVWPDTLTVTLPSGVKDRLSRVLLPLTGEYGPQEGNSSVLIFFGIEAYGTPALINEAAQAELTRIGELLGR